MSEHKEILARFYEYLRPRFAQPGPPAPEIVRTFLEVNAKNRRIDQHPNYAYAQAIRSLPSGTLDRLSEPMLSDQAGVIALSKVEPSKQSLALKWVWVPYEKGMLQKAIRIAMKIHPR